MSPILPTHAQRPHAPRPPISSVAEWRAVEAELAASLKNGVALDAALAELRTRHAGIGPVRTRLLTDFAARFSAPKPVAPKPVAPKPVAPKPVAPKPVAPKPVAPNPVAPKPVVPKPVAPKPVEPKPVGHRKYVPAIIQMFGREHWYQVPSAADGFSNADVKGTLIVFHGCSRCARGYWPWGSHPRALGFPQDVSLLKQALRAGWAVMVPDPSGPTMCWNNTLENLEAETKAVLAEFFRRTSLAAKPIVLTGASSGAWGIDTAVRDRWFSDVVGAMYVVAGHGPRAGQPPTTWTIMNRANDVAAAREYVRLQNAGKTVDGRGACASTRAAGPLVCMPVAVTDSFFADQMPFVDGELSARMVAIMRRLGFVGPDDGLIPATKSPKPDNPAGRALASAFRTELAGFTKPPLYVGTVGGSAVTQALLYAKGQHEHIGDFVGACLAWFESGGTADLAQLAREMRVTKPALLD